jgi:BirA family biotin operon repressor/biotin-[acetyl-CoA-carboxylase] ligase
MATPYLQLRREEVTSTQDVARDELDGLPVVVISARQTAGRGRSGALWISAPRALAVSVAFEIGGEDQRPFPLMAGVAAARAVSPVSLKWPNDLLIGDDKLGGILVERSGDRVVAGLGLNLWWPEPPSGVGSLFGVDPGEDMHARIGAMWAAELMHLVDLDDWPRGEYLSRCATVGRRITWEPDGLGLAVDVSESGELVVEQEGVLGTLSSGAVRHVTRSPS